MLSTASFTKEYMSEYGYHTIQRNIKKEQENLKRLGSILVKIRIKLTRITILKPLVVKSYLNYLNIKKPVELDNILNALEINNKKKPIKKFIENNQDYLLSQKIICSSSDSAVCKPSELLTLFFESQEGSS